jgi:hypothetical protein
MAIDLFAGVPVSNFAVAQVWYEQLLGFPPAFFPNDVEAVWEIAEHRFLYIEHLPEHAGHALITIFVTDFDARLTAMVDLGLEPEKQEVYENGVRKAIFRDPDGNEVSFGGAPL